MPSETLLGPWVRRYLAEHLVTERNLASNTQLSYRDTLALLLPFLSALARRAVDRLCVQDVSAERVRRVLRHLGQGSGVQHGTPATSGWRPSARLPASWRAQSGACRMGGQLRACAGRRVPRPGVHLTQSRSTPSGAPDPPPAAGVASACCVSISYNTEGARHGGRPAAS